jgi:hypothetical protein
MVEHQSDKTAVQYPTSGKGPKDVGEIFDYILRKGPVRLRTVQDKCNFMSSSEVFGCVDWLETHGYVAKNENGELVVPKGDSDAE